MWYFMVSAVVLAAVFISLGIRAEKELDREHELKRQADYEKETGKTTNKEV